MCLRDGETTIEITFSVLRGGTLGREESRPKLLFFLGKAMTIKFWKCKFYRRGDQPGDTCQGSMQTGSSPSLAREARTNTVENIVWPEMTFHESMTEAFGLKVWQRTPYYCYSFPLNAKTFYRCRFYVRSKVKLCNSFGCNKLWLPCWIASLSLLCKGESAVFPQRSLFFISH